MASLSDLLSSPWLQNDAVLPLALLALSLLILYTFLSTSSSSTRLPPGPRAVPLLGNLHQLDPELHAHFASLARTHGPILKLRLGNRLGIVITSPSLAREVLKDNDVIFANRDVPVAGRIATGGGNDVVWTPYGPEWRMLRKVCVVKMLGKATLDGVYGLRRREVRAAVGFCYDRVGSEVNVGEQMFLTALNVITSMLWGGTVEGKEGESLGSEFRRIVSEMTDLLARPNVSDFYPGLARFDLQGVEKKMTRLARRLDDMFDQIIGQRSVKGEEKKSKDFLQYLLELKDGEQDLETPLTMVHVKALLMDMVVGGSETSSNTVEFAMAEIMNQPEIMKRAQEELDRVIGSETVVEESHIQKLEYLKAIMKETLRLHPALPLMVPHCPSQSCTVGGYTVPKGSRIFINVWAIQRDPAVWEDPLRFDPGRFLESGVDFSGSDFDYLPFGSGRRICAGIVMAEKMVLYSLATLLHSFDWKVADGQKLDLREKFGIVMKKKIPLVAIPTPRFSHPKLYQ